jgi:tripartite ATP-independent transporter DctP family solute receptor
MSNGAVEVEIFPNGQLGGELEMLTQVRQGDLDMELMGAGILASIDPAFSISELPFIWKDAASVKKVLTGPVGEKILKRLDDKGIKGLAFGAWGLRGFLTTAFPVKAPTDLKGRKIRVIENPVYVRTMRAFGTNPLPMAWPEVYSALQQKTIDGVETNYFGMADGKLQEVAKNLAVTDHIFTATAFIMNMGKYKALPANVQEIVAKAAKAGGEVMFGGAEKANQDAIDAMVKGGVTITHPDISAFKAAVKPVHDYFAGQVGGDLLKEVIAAQQ